MLELIKKWLGGKPKIAAPEKTVVAVRRMSVPFKMWNAKVFYDAWGSPYIYSPLGITMQIHQHHRVSSYDDDQPRPLNGKEGRCGDGPWTTEWKLISGPDVTWGDRPNRPFDRDPA
jgi:hypothetical protein